MWRLSQRRWTAVSYPSRIEAPQCQTQPTGERLGARGWKFKFSISTQPFCGCFRLVFQGDRVDGVSWHAQSVRVPRNSRGLLEQCPPCWLIWRAAWHVWGVHPTRRWGCGAVAKAITVLFFSSSAVGPPFYSSVLPVMIDRVMNQHAALNTASSIADMPMCAIEIAN